MSDNVRIIQLTEHRFVNLSAIADFRFDVDLSGQPQAQIITQYGYPIDLYGDDALRLRQELEPLAETDADAEDRVSLAMPPEGKD